MTRTKLIIAVFGSTETSSFPLAEKIGSAIAQKNQVLLTGGKGVEDGTVKEKAILGAKEEAKRSNWAANWIGVDRTSKIGFKIDYQGRAFKLQTDLDHKRNCLEACLCDAAIALEGEDGTISEALYTLWLGKRVVFVGDISQKRNIIAHNGSVTSVNFEEMICAAHKRVGSILASDYPLNTLFDKDVIEKGLKRLQDSANYKWYPTPTNEGKQLEVIQNALLWLLETNVTGDFPMIAGYANIAAEYKKWLSKINGNNLSIFQI